MDETDHEVQCPNCHRTISVEPEWRMVQCPGCAQMITRMTEDRSYD
jgi:predicted RNA-binding Zn-ribbon protein involved in translation (DUF1610 family)